MYRKHRWGDGKCTSDLAYVTIWVENDPALGSDLCTPNVLSKQNKILSEKDECRQTERTHMTK